LRKIFSPEIYVLRFLLTITAREAGSKSVVRLFKRRALLLKDAGVYNDAKMSFEQM